MKRVKKGVIKELFSEIWVFLVKKGSYTTLQIAKIWKILKKIGKIRKSWSMTKNKIKKVIKNFGRENGNFFLKKRHSEILVCEIFSRLPKLGARSPPMSILVFTFKLQQQIRLETLGPGNPSRATPLMRMN